MSNCSSSCLTQEHETWGECVRAKGLRLNPNLSDTSRSKKWDKELQAYRDARSQGIQPAGTTMDKIREADQISQKTGQAFRGA